MVDMVYEVERFGRIVSKSCKDLWRSSTQDITYHAGSGGGGRRSAAAASGGQEVRRVSVPAAEMRRRLRARALLPGLPPTPLRLRAQGLRRQQRREAAPGSLATTVLLPSATCSLN
uniref:cDNA clone:001-120-E04, full insert sequence n=1 Tax=Oryza sativa subsp. japonica TaxID=39947 RepID=B7F4I8_ORYSJ|nr:unnamed protein product [Oryza sativa Japonica Group]